MRRAEVKYILAPDWVRSQSDGQMHYIGAEQLVRLYGVRRDECMLQPRLVPLADDLIVLAPRYDGKYEVPA